jgi:hypothetical protein
MSNLSHIEFFSLQQRRLIMMCHCGIILSATCWVIRIFKFNEKIELTSLERSLSFSKQFEGCGQTAFVSDNFKSHDCASFFLLREIAHID